jgi:hypothetical protein
MTSAKFKPLIFSGVWCKFNGVLFYFQVSVGLRIEKLEVLGNYTMTSWFSRSSGPFNVTLSNVYIEGLAKLEVERGGQLQAQNIDMDISFRDIAMNFENLGFLGNLFQVCAPSRG